MRMPLSRGVSEPDGDLHMNNPNPDTRRFTIPDHGTNITTANAVWLMCEQLDVRDAMEVGQTKDLRFRSGVGASVVSVTRTA